MKLNEYQELSKRTLPEHDGCYLPDALANYSLGLAGESGECVDHIKKHVYHGHELNVEELAKELGDVLHYIAGLSTMIGLELEDIAAGNIDKLLIRFPNGFTVEDSINRLDN